jgi:hypothetical protein
MLGSSNYPTRDNLLMDWRIDGGHGRRSVGVASAQVIGLSPLPCLWFLGKQQLGSRHPKPIHFLSSPLLQKPYTLNEASRDYCLIVIVPSAPISVHQCLPPIAYRYASIHPYNLAYDCNFSFGEFRAMHHKETERSSSVCAKWLSAIGFRHRSFQCAPYFFVYS